MIRELRMGMTGGALDAFIGGVHRRAALMDGGIVLTAGVFSRDRERSLATARAYGVAEDRVYPDYRTMFESERARGDGIDFVTVATPNDTHLAIAAVALASDIAVLSDKPAAASLTEAETLEAHVAAANAPYALTYTYTGYPLVREARALVAAGAIGTVRKVVVEYFQGWLAEPIEARGNRQAAWRTDPARSGVGGCIGDIGVHAFHLAEFVTGLSTQRLLADLGSVVPGRHLDDDCNILLRMTGGVRGTLLASQVAIGEANGLRLRVYGSLGGIDWRQEVPDKLNLHHLNGNSEILRGGSASLGIDAQAATRLPAGHPEGYLEAFANLYRDFATVLRGGHAPLLPGITDGVRSLRFVEAAVAASRDESGWVTLDEGAVR